MPTASNEKIRTISPSTGKPVYECPGTSLENAQKILSAAETAFPHWRRTPLDTRKSIVRKAMCLIQSEKHLLGDELTMQIGRPIAYSVKEIETMQKRANYLLSIADEALSDVAGMEEEGFRRWIRKEPVGPVLIIFAWNFPYLIIVNALIPALLAGNTVVLKPSPQTPLVGERMVKIFAEAGLPSDTLQILHCGDAKMLKQIVQIPAIQLITFTGSTKVGLELREAAAGRCVPLNLELGGNDPAYVRVDADLKYVAAQLVDGAVFNAGQSCCAVERIYVDATIHDDFVEAVKAELSSYKIGDPADVSTNVGPVISKAAKATIEAQVDDALQKGAIDATPSNILNGKLSTEGNYVTPRILLNVNHKMDVMREETFGPIIPIMRVSNDEEAIALMNDSHYGLTASVWTKDISRGHEIIEDLEAGTVFTNRADYPSPDLAWTGWKASGLGCTLGPRGFDAFFKLKSFHVKKRQG